MALSEEVKAKLAGGKSKMVASKADIMARLKAEPHPDPLAGVEYVNDIEKDAKAEMNALGQGLSGHAKEWAEKFKTMNDTEFWCAFCFKSREDKEKFLQALGVMDLGDKYIHGPRAAKILGIEGIDGADEL